VNDYPTAIEIPINGTLDLHLFQPREIPSLINEYLQECQNRGILDVRIIHGKGKGVLREATHSALKKNPLVLEFKLDSGPSGWGATVVRLKNVKEGEKNAS
jgi:DNA-nicking Smr family endonuclease